MRNARLRGTGPAWGQSSDGKHVLCPTKGTRALWLGRGGRSLTQNPLPRLTLETPAEHTVGVTLRTDQERGVPGGTRCGSGDEYGDQGPEEPEPKRRQTRGTASGGLLGSRGELPRVGIAADGFRHACRKDTNYSPRTGPLASTRKRPSSRSRSSAKTNSVKSSGTTCTPPDAYVLLDVGVPQIHELAACAYRDRTASRQRGWLALHRHAEQERRHSTRRGRNRRGHLAEAPKTASNPSSWARRKLAGLSNCQYIRFRRFFILCATDPVGGHEFFAAHPPRHAADGRNIPQVRHIKEHPISFGGYSIGYHRGVDRKWHISIRIHPERYRDLKAILVDLATKRSKEHIVAEFRRLPFEPYAPVRRQFLLLLRAVNRARIEKGFDQVIQADLNAAWRVGEGKRERWLTRCVVRPFWFGADEAKKQAAA